MNRRYYISGVFLLMILLMPTTAIFANSSFEYWNRESAEWKINKKFKVSLDEEVRFNSGGRGFYHWFSDPGLAFSPFAWLELGVNYRFILEKNKKKHWEYENRPHLNVTLKTSLYGFDLSDRSRFEYRDKEKGDDGWRYRNESKIKLPWKFTRFELRPYAAEEFFVDFDKSEINKNRVYGGIEFKLFKHVKGDLYYLWQADHVKSSWTSTNVLGTKLRLSF